GRRTDMTFSRNTHAIPKWTEVLWQTFYAIVRPAVIWISPAAHREHSRKDLLPTWGAHCSGGVHAVKLHTLGSQFRQMGRFNIPISIRSNIPPPKIIGKDQ